MSYNKTELFFFLKPENFYRQDFVRAIRNTKNGYEYLTLYEELLIESLNKDGILANCFGEEIVPYTTEEIATIFQHKPIIVKEGLEILEKYKVIEKKEKGIYFFPDALEYTKRQTIGAQKKKEQRENKREKMDKCPSSDDKECPTDIDTKKEIKLKRNNNEMEEQDNNESKLLIKKILSLFNEYEGYDKYHYDNVKDNSEIRDKINKCVSENSFLQALDILLNNLKECLKTRKLNGEAVKK